MELNDGVELIFRVSWLIFVIADTFLPRILQQISQIVLINVKHSLVDPELLESHLKNFSDESKESKKKNNFCTVSSSRERSTSVPAARRFLPHPRVDI